MVAINWREVECIPFFVASTYVFFDEKNFVYITDIIITKLLMQLAMQK